MAKNYDYLFGPVPSRRLGRSLGVDLIPFKTCTMDCTFCQLGETPCTVSKRDDYVPIKDVLAELDQWKGAGGEADHITLAGSGEPTLHTYFGDVFRWAKSQASIPSVLLTNGSLLHDPQVRAEAALADKVKVTMSAWDEASFQQIHRPADGVSFDLLVKGERAFREEYTGELSVEVFVVDGVNSEENKIKKIAAIVETLNPDHVDLNTAVRPPAVKGVAAVSEKRLQALAEFFGPKANVTASFKNQGFQSMEISEDALVGLIKRHPVTCEQLAKEYNVASDKMFKMLDKMAAIGLLREEKGGADTYYFHREL